MPPSPIRSFPNEVATFSNHFVFTTLTPKDASAHGKVPYGHPVTKKPCSLFTLDNEMRYTSFAMDHGPLNLAFTFHACIKIHEKLEKAKEKRKPVCLYSSTDPKIKSNMVLIVALYSLIVDKQLPWNAFHPVAHFEVMPFRDAGSGPMDHGLTVQDILYGIEKAISFGLLDLTSFDVDDYQYHETVENGDLNILGHFIPFASPVETTWINVARASSDMTYAETSKSKAIHHPLRCVLSVFKRENVGLIARLNEELYDKRHFLDMGMEHVDMYFDDGTNPPDEIVKEFIRLAEETIERKGMKVAVHCKAGLGRTGVLIGAYLIYKYRFTAQEAIGFMRIVRPGMVVGPQQQYMVLNQMRWAGWAARDQFLKELAQTTPSNNNNPLATPTLENINYIGKPQSIGTPTRLVVHSTMKLRSRQPHTLTAPIICVSSQKGADAVGQPRKVCSTEKEQERKELQSTQPLVLSSREPLQETNDCNENEFSPGSVSSVGSVRGTKRAARRSANERKPLPILSLNMPLITLARADSCASLSSDNPDQDARPPKRRTASSKGSPLAQNDTRPPSPSRGSTSVSSVEQDEQENIEPELMLIDIATPIKSKVSNKLHRRESTSPAPSTPSCPPISVKHAPLSAPPLGKTTSSKRSFLPVRHNDESKQSSFPHSREPKASAAIGAKSSSAKTLQPETSRPKSLGLRKQMKSKSVLTPPRISEITKLHAGVYNLLVLSMCTCVFPES
ncbi:hypothetical protein L204_103642 [Cryptococcus depauperatus]